MYRYLRFGVGHLSAAPVNCYCITDRERCHELLSCVETKAWLTGGLIDVEIHGATLG